jgi:hypothetical protein
MIPSLTVKQLKGAWMARLKGSGFGGKYSAEATPLVGGVDLLKRGVALIGKVATIRHPVLADRALHQFVDFGIGDRPAPPAPNIASACCSRSRATLPT